MSENAPECEMKGEIKNAPVEKMKVVSENANECKMEGEIRNAPQSEMEGEEVKEGPIVSVGDAKCSIVLEEQQEDIVERAQQTCCCTIF